MADRPKIKRRTKLEVAHEERAIEVRSAGPPTKENQLTEAKIVKTLFQPDVLGILSVAAEKLGCTPGTMTYWVQKSEKVREAAQYSQMLHAGKVDLKFRQHVMGILEDEALSDKYFPQVKFYLQKHVPEIYGDKDKKTIVPKVVINLVPVTREVALELNLENIPDAEYEEVKEVEKDENIKEVVGMMPSG